MSGDEFKHPNFSSAEAIAVALIGGIVAIFNKIYKPPNSPSSSPSVSLSSAPTAVPTSPSSPTLQVPNAFLGKWSGVAKEP